MNCRSLSLLFAAGFAVAVHAQTPAPLSASSPSPSPSPAALNTRPAAAVGNATSGAGTSSSASAASAAAAGAPAAPTPAGPAGNTVPTAPTDSTLAGPGGPRVTWSEVRVNGPYIAMTFDDGPHPTLTPQLLDMLKQRGIHATFFVLGSLAKDHPEILKRAVAEGHEIANHSWDHPNLGKMSDEAVRSQLTRTQAVIASAIGKAGDLMRPPYGSVTAAQKKWFHDELGLKIILWSVDPLDWKNHDPATITRRIAEGTRSGGIVLAHDIHKTTVEAMPATLDGLLAKGFKFVTVSQLLAMELPPEPKKSGAAATGTGQPGAAVPRRTPAPGVPEKITGTEPGATPPATPTPTPEPTPTPKKKKK